MNRRPLVAGNWKMNGSRAANAALLKDVLAGVGPATAAEVVVCPPAVYLTETAAAVDGTVVAVGGQTVCEQSRAGAFTGEILADMLLDVGCSYVIVGHSERRALYGEDDHRVAEKFGTAHAAGVIPILCLGETLEERESGQTEAVLARQLEAVLTAGGIEPFSSAVIAYEPVWAIGTGRTASPEQAQAVHAFLRGQLARVNATIANSTRILYGGSVKPDNARELFGCADIDGGLIGGASLKAADFLAIVNAADGQH